MLAVAGATRPGRYHLAQAAADPKPGCTFGWPVMAWFHHR
jgi:hypothetical protein